ncbi:hypothetical protein J7L67_04935 [bacterium]|nr:hypothetical protein [bacterium]
MEANQELKHKQELDEDTVIHNEVADKVMVLVSACVSGGTLWFVACIVLKYAWYSGLAYFVGMFVWVVLFFEYFNYSLFRKPPE